MKCTSICVATLAIVLELLVSTTVSTRNISGRHSAEHRATTSEIITSGKVANNNNNNEKVAAAAEKLCWGQHERERSRPIMKHRAGPDTVQVAGSTLPDCSHACGSCSPCRLVAVSFVCASLEEAETCPMAYKCMCKNKSYPVP